MVRKAYKKKLTTAELRHLGMNPNLVIRKVRRPTAKKLCNIAYEGLRKNRRAFKKGPPSAKPPPSDFLPTPLPAGRTYGECSVRAGLKAARATRKWLAERGQIRLGLISQAAGSALYRDAAGVQ